MEMETGDAERRRPGGSPASWRAHQMLDLAQLVGASVVGQCGGHRAPTQWGRREGERDSTSDHNSARGVHACGLEVHSILNNAPSVTMEPSLPPSKCAHACPSHSCPLGALEPPGPPGPLGLPLQEWVPPASDGGVPILRLRVVGSRSAAVGCGCRRPYGLQACALRERGAPRLVFGGSRLATVRGRR